MKLSVVIPTYNEASRIKPFIDSVRRQTVPAEIIFIDGGSTDGTKQIIMSSFVGAQVEWVQLIEEIGKRCPANARNMGIDAATGEILVSLNVDTVLEDDYVKKIVAAFEEHPEADAITFNHDLTMPSGMTMIGKALFLRDQVYGYNGKYTVMKTSYWRKIGHYDSELGFGEDRHMRRSYEAVPCKTISVDEHIGVSETSFQDLSGYTKRNLWYGRTIPRYLSKERDLPIALYYLMAILFVPFIIFATKIAIMFLCLVIAYGGFRTLKIMNKEDNKYNCNEAMLIPLLEVYGYIIIGCGFYQWLLGNKIIGR